MKKIIAISGSTRKNSSNFKILAFLSKHMSGSFEIEFFENLDKIPHFNPDLDTENPPEEVQNLRTKIALADGVLICTPEYVFSLPGSLKNLLEWCVSTTVFSHKKTGLITASASGEKGHEQLLLIMETLNAQFEKEAQLLIQGVRGKINPEGNITDEKTLSELTKFANDFEKQFG